MNEKQWAKESNDNNEDNMKIWKWKWNMKNGENNEMTWNVIMLIMKTMNNEIIIMAKNDNE